MISRNFIRSSILYTVAGTLPMASAVILLPFYTYYLSSSTFGAFSILLSFSLLIQVIVTFSFDASVYVHFHEYKKDTRKLSAFISSAYWFMLLLATVLAVILMSVGDLILSNVTEQRISFYPYGFAALFTGIFQSFFKVYNNLLQTSQRPALYLRSNLLAFLLTAGLTIAGLYLRQDSLIGPIGARLLAALICGAWACWRVAREYGLKLDYPLLRSSFGFNFYSFIYQLQQWVMSYFDRILLLFFLPLATVGVYGFLMSCLMVVEFILNGLYNSFSPRIVGILYDQNLKSSTVEINRYYHGLTAVSMVLVTSIILLFPLAVEMFIERPDYQGVIPYIPFAILIYLFKPMRLYFSIPFGILKFTKPLPLIYGVVSTVKVVLLLLLTERFGLYGVIASSLISYALEIGLLYASARNRFAFNFNSFKLLIAPLSILAMVAVLEPLMGDAFPIPLHFLYMLTCLVLLVAAYRKELRLIDPLNILKK